MLSRQMDGVTAIILHRMKNHHNIPIRTYSVSVVVNSDTVVTFLHCVSYDARGDHGWR